MRMAALTPVGVGVCTSAEATKLDMVFYCARHWAVILRQILFLWARIPRGARSLRCV